MWKLEKTTIGAREVEARIRRAEDPLTFEGFLAGLADDGDFRRFFTGALRTLPMPAFVWETPPVTRATLDQQFECRMVESPSLDRFPADPKPFAEHFRAGELVATFPSLGGDALLVAPTPGADPAAYAHLGAFVRGAPEEQVDALWKAVAAAVRARLGAAPIWLSTAGLGVAWLHVRVDERPKYYRTAKYAGVRG